MPTVTTWIKRAGALLLVLLIMTCTTQGRYKVLSTFFDGVPKPRHEAAASESAARVTPTRVAVVAERVMKSRHKPFAERDCSGCHETRSAQNLRVAKTELCFTCHEAEQFQGKFVHGPVASGHCDTCHLAHESKHELLLLADNRNLCLSCHETADIETIPNHAEQAVCHDCHEPHASDNAYFVKDETRKQELLGSQK